MFRGNTVHVTVSRYSELLQLFLFEVVTVVCCVSIVCPSVNLKSKYA